MSIYEEVGGAPTFERLVHAFYEGVAGEQAWATERDGVRVLIAGNADEPELRTLAEAVLQAPTRP